MPAASRPRQASVAEWFATEQGRRLDDLQSRAVAERLPQRPSQPLLWLAPHPQWPACRPPGPRVVCLQDAGGQWCGDLHAGLPLPLSSASFGTVVVQMPDRSRGQALLAEVERVLLPGGLVWLLVGSPAHPARLLHPQHRLWDAPPGGWRTALRGAGLQLRQVQRLGPAGLALESATVLLEAEKRTLAAIGPRPARPLVPRLASRSIRTKVT